MALTLDNINKIINDSKAGSFRINYDDLVVTAKNNLTIEEQHQIIHYVIEESFTDYEYSALNFDVAFAIAVMKVCTDIPLPTKEENGETYIDSEKAYEIAHWLDIIPQYKALLPLIEKLELFAKEEVSIKIQKQVALYGSSTATNEAIETFSSAMMSLSGLLDALSVQVEKNGSKLLKSINNKKINEIITKAVSALNGMENKGVDVV